MAVATLRAGTFLNTGLAITGLDLSAFWWPCCAQGDSHTPARRFDYLNDDSAWTVPDHDVAAHVLNQCCTTKRLGQPVTHAHALCPIAPGDTRRADIAAMRAIREGPVQWIRSSASSGASNSTCTRAP